MTEIFLQQIHNFYVYAIICGVIGVYRLYFLSPELKLEVVEKIKQIGGAYDLSTLYCITFVFGFIIVPLWIACKILKLFGFELF